MVLVRDIFFFFQAEDGIRDGRVTGVQTCALPIFWQQAREGHASAFGVLFERHAGRIYNYCFRRTGDWALAEDLTSTTFVLAWRSRGRAPLQAEIGRASCRERG